MTNPDFRALCARLLKAAEYYTGWDSDEMDEAMAAARAALAQPPAMPEQIDDSSLRIRITRGWVNLTDYQACVTYYPPMPNPHVPAITAPPSLTITIEAMGPFSFEPDSPGQTDV